MIAFNNVYSVPHSRWKLAAFALLYLAFIVYGSLVPFRYYPIPLEEAWTSFQQIRYRDLGIGSRADWVANIILYIPLSFLIAATITPNHPSKLGNIFRYQLTFLFCVSIAIGVEFTQQFFKPRTVSQNDLIAETLGTLLGLLLWSRFRLKLKLLWSSMMFGGAKALRAALILYVSGLLAITFFPYDFVISAEEVADKLSGDSHGWFFTPGGCKEIFRCLLKLAAEVLVVTPVGFLLATQPRRVANEGYGNAFFIGLSLGVGIEFVQLFLASGISQGASVVTRIAGVLLGLHAVNLSKTIRFEILRLYLQPAILLAALPYVFVVMSVNGWFSNGWLSPDEAMANVANIKWLPFYHHYFTSEAVALVSTLAQFGLYAGVGVAVWLWKAGRHYPPDRGALTATVLAVMLALIVEFGKLFVHGKHPDLTNILIAACAAPISFGFMALAAGWLAAEPVFQVASPIRSRLNRSNELANVSGPQPPRRIDSAVPILRDAEQRYFPVAGSASNIQHFVSIALVAVAAIAAVQYPLGPGWMLTALAGYAFVLWRYPLAWLFCLPALLPSMDLAPWSGWFFFDEFDFVAVVTLAVLFSRQPFSLAGTVVSRPFRLCLGIVMLSYLVSGIIGLVPLSPLDENAFSNYYSHYNGLRIFKGSLYGWLFFPFLAQAVSHYRSSVGVIIAGMLAGLTLVSAAGLLERALFASLWDFSNDFRITSTFSGMHTGGAYLEAYIVAALPFILAMLFYQRSPSIFIGAGLLLICAVYTLFMTFSRAAFVGVGVTVIVLAVGAVIASRGTVLIQGRSLLTSMLIVIACAALAVPVLSGNFMKYRIERIGDDAASRLNLWSDALSIRDDDWIKEIFGMGLGRYPETNFWRRPHGARPATYSFQREGDNIYLKLGSGNPLYLLQRITLTPNRNYRLSVKLRSTSADSRLKIDICEKALQYSFACRSAGLSVEKPDKNWRRFVRIIDLSTLGKPRFGIFTRPVSVSIRNPMDDTLIDVDELHLYSVDGEDIISNGDFSNGHDRWFIESNSHSHWHIFNLWVHLWFEQGLFGLLACNLLFAYVFIRLFLRIRAGDRLAGVLFASLAGLFAVGLTGSLLDSPRILFLVFFLLCFAAATEPARTQQRHVHTPRQPSNGARPGR